MTAESVLVEIRAAEGGDDAKGLVREQMAVYANVCELRGLSAEIIEERPGLLVFEARGRRAVEVFAGETGGHRWQRVPPTERRGRRHTSTVTVAVLPLEVRSDVVIGERDIEWQATRGSGKGGQHRNKTSSAVQMRHLPSGITVRVEAERSQHQNRATALRILSARLSALAQGTATSERAQTRRGQVGTGQRGDKIRTVRTQDDSVVDHRTNKRTSFSRYRRGHLEDFVA